MMNCVKLSLESFSGLNHKLRQIPSAHDEGVVALSADRKRKSNKEFSS